MAVRLSALRAGSPLPPGRFLVLISVRGWLHNGDGRIRSVEKSSDLIANRTRNLPACSVVTQPTTLPGGPKLLMQYFLFIYHFWHHFQIVGALNVNILSRIWGVTIDGVWMVNGFTDTRLVNACNHSATANLHTLQITTAPVKPFSSLLCLYQP
jgi:hypothetical protein